MRTPAALLGPFIGHTTETSSKIWLRNRNGAKAVIQLYRENLPIGPSQTIEFLKEHLWAGVASFNSLQPNTQYTYKIFDEKGGEYPLLELSQKHLTFWTMPTLNDWNHYRYDFMLMSCNNPDESIDKKAGRDGYEVWEAIPAILNAHTTANRGSRILFALMGGDQVYADGWRSRLLSAISPEEKIEIYLEVYEHYWTDTRYRQVMATLPSYLMWDDHDIMDGWGSETTSFSVDEDGNPTALFRPEWASMFVAAKRAFQFYQASRNPDPLPRKGESFDVGFRVGPMGFVLADLRTNRNWQARVFWTDEQIKAVEAWIDQNQNEMEVLFFLTPVVVAHGSPIIEEGLVKNWDLVLKFFKHARESQRKVTAKGINAWKWGLGALFAVIVSALSLAVVLLKQPWLRAAIFYAPFVGLYLLWSWIQRIKRRDLLKQLELIKMNQGGKTITGWLLHVIGLFLPSHFIDDFDNKAGDLSDDIRDSWAGPGNEKSVEHLLKTLFDLQNHPEKEKRVHVAILSGDIHAAGYSNIYSSKSEHQERPVIPHIVASPVGYSPFPWFAEAFYRKFSIGKVALGNSNSFYAQNSHYFTERNVVVCSLRRPNEHKLILKAKFYVEGYSEPQTSVFDLQEVSHREDVYWPRGRKE